MGPLGKLQRFADIDTNVDGVLSFHEWNQVVRLLDDQVSLALSAAIECSECE